MGFSRQEYWSGLPCPPPGDLPDPGIEPRSPALQADSLSSESPGKPSFFLKVMIISFPSFFFMTWGTKIDVPEAIFLHRPIHTHTGQDKRGKMGS